MSKFNDIQREISRIQFHTDFDRKTKNKMIAKLEKELEAVQE